MFFGKSFLSGGSGALNLPGNNTLVDNVFFFFEKVIRIYEMGKYFLLLRFTFSILDLFKLFYTKSMITFIVNVLWCANTMKRLLQEFFFSKWGKKLREQVIVVLCILHHNLLLHSQLTQIPFFWGRGKSMYTLYSFNPILIRFFRLCFPLNQRDVANQREFLFYLI